MFLGVRSIPLSFDTPKVDRIRNGNHGAFMGFLTLDFVCPSLYVQYTVVICLFMVL